VSWMTWRAISARPEVEVELIGEGGLAPPGGAAQPETRSDQGLPLLHISAQPEPFLSLKPPNVSQSKRLRRAKKGTSVSPWLTPVLKAPSVST